MQHIVTQRVICGLTIPDGISLTIDDFTFLPDFEGEHQARHIKTIVEANTKEEATAKTGKLFSDFLAELTLIDNSKYILGNDMSVTLIGVNEPTTQTRSITASAFIVQDGMRIKTTYEATVKGKHIRKSPLRLYRDAINTDGLFEKYRTFYRVLESYGGTTAISSWIRKQLGKPEMKKNKNGQPITIYTWIRIKLSHSKSQKGDLEPFLISNPAHVAIVNRYLPEIQRLARTIIKERERV
ncbi:MAG: hypothetical protein A2857_03725 [Candidatus Levybacteria bacterium RIFCSPHIGHO2_01_FULL_36_15]|nr:MAG: hypothetical protein A2857_03725 [Candidatus Levybacteria bacterium RIFCSPHIGHO2_01_FULL_36_15]OGH37245.1 MAG: hypothetical protein A2905_06115 [Candidatus Levybacteria bacterium RIFCSPLOWO2_01_FULL_36_10]